MLSLQLASLHRNLLSSSRANTEANKLGGGTATFNSTSRQKRCCSSSVTVRAAEKRDSQPQQQYEIDPDKAREALLKLDQQLESLSKKQIPSPKIRASDVKLARDRTPTEDNALEISGSFLPYLSVALVVFTIFYNVLFYAVIKPSIDGPDYIPEINLSLRPEAPNAEAMGYSSTSAPPSLGMLKMSMEEPSRWAEG